MMRIGCAMGLGLWLLATVAGCKVKAGGDDADNLIDEIEDIDREDVEETVRETAEDVRDLEVCPGYTLEELFQADSLSDECRQSLLSFLPEPETTFDHRLVAPGGVRAVGGELRLLLQGADAEGAPISAEALAALEVHVTIDGEERLLGEGEFTLALAADLPDDLIALSVVNDYSASMTDGDLRDVAEVEQDLFACLPPVYQGEVIRFSDDVERQLPFTSDAQVLGSTVDFDDSFDRGRTALIDGLGTATDSLAAAAEPVRILLVSTDGRENASMLYEQAEVFGALDDNRVFVVALGALLADVDFMRDLADGRGVFFYTREFSALQEAAMPYLESLKDVAELRVGALDPPPTAIRVVLADVELELELDVEL